MVLMASASDHRHRRAAKSYHPPNPASSPSPSKVPAEKSSARAGLLGISFGWGAQRRLRCSKDGAPVYDDSASPSLHPHTPSPDKEQSNPPPPQDTPAPAGGFSSRPQRPRNLRPLRYAASRPDGGAGQTALLHTPTPKPSQAQPRKRGFAVALTMEEMARDFAAIRRCTTRPVPAARRAKKRLNAVQDAIDHVCPGQSLKDVDLDNYKIEERVPKR